MDYCPISKDIYLTLKDFLEPEQMGRVLMCVCDDFFETEERIDMAYNTEHKAYTKLYNWAQNKYNSWYQSHKKFFEENPKKKENKEKQIKGK